ncbi:MAG: [NiFe]-hydrogenase assembly chaperone HybE [Gammaproteobacteria bacterium]|jgi:[NiFe] hydrogenase assembly HybE family chaperone|nr:[NiFe]-hydrogenase assembly chaperone HybE [Gammaproteobacteria bacterium]MBT3725937.1 [NiFe]-hydrogenase assembly chaperone HybE [Gammaproteobacteria bacterium]MBT4078456.1 [NiFe]-hydrogenase assembly chaperone HybE [Gammaproteobacteria bacterium]MBT4195876.1 [NiFe]-hydrogenase assembly chaperone HybE [Gammaproteobacteria bacterium]MBT4448984.1 [NiFe]-hydrogenase assembly chaperone HybE [Gammaproteobacteria bacterium]
MKNLQNIIDVLEATFERIHLEQMQGIPILNSAIKVQALGFQLYQGRVLGVIITPWLMNIVMLPKQNEEWSNMELGHKQPHKFPSKNYKFMVNNIDGIGPCQTHSLYSPMRDFASHEQAVTVAQEFLDSLMVEKELTEEDMVDEELLGRVMRGEDTPEINLDDFAVIEPMAAGVGPVRGQSDMKVQVKEKLSRRDLLRGNFK